MGGLKSSAEERAMIRKYAERGDSYVSIAKRLHRSPAFVSNVMNKKETTWPDGGQTVVPVTSTVSGTTKKETLDTKTFAEFILAAPISKELKLQILTELL